MSTDAERPDRTAIHHRAEAMAGELPALMVAAERVASTVSQGVHGRRRVGQGESFWQFRRYETGDALHSVDWRQSARAEPLYVREMEWEAAQSVWLWRDGSPSMSFLSDPEIGPKSDRADLLLLALASLLVRGGERVGLLGSGLSPSSGRGAPARILSLIESGQCPQTSLPVIERLPRYARALWFGDFLAPLDEVKKAISNYADRGVRGHLVQVLDPAESLLPYDGRIQFGGMEYGEPDILVRHVGALREAYRTALAAHQAGLREVCASVGWSFLDHRTDHAPEPVLLTLYLHFSESEGR